MIRGMKDKEAYSGIRIDEKPFCVIRCDGRNFHALTERVGFKKPYDRRLIEALIESSITIFKEFPCVKVAFAFSDEVSFLLAKPYPFNGRVEKLDSIFASLLSSAFTCSLYSKLRVLEVVSFDARIVTLDNLDDILDYFAWRQMEAYRNFLNSYAYHAMRKRGLSPRRVAEALKGLKAKELIKVIKRSGVDIEKLPSWQSRGVLIFRRRYEKTGYDPMKRIQVKALRHRVDVCWDLPLFAKEGQDFLRRTIENSMY
ncbi:MAG: guanylyltransferase [Thermoprotei archaeon]|nr:MAG: guanylyltransferase [Thermoprotei archaeon]RLF25934.1 MAG: guanylyltransferase [Thermoprotei archaeon]